MKEVKQISMNRLMQLCIERKWFSKGDNEEYEKMLFKADSIKNLTLEDMQEIAETIFKFTYKSDFEQYGFFDDEEIILFIVNEINYACIRFISMD